MTIAGSLTSNQLTTLSQAGTYSNGNAKLEIIKGSLTPILQDQFDNSVVRIRESMGECIGSMFWVCAFTGAAVMLVSYVIIRKNNKKA